MKMFPFFCQCSTLGVCSPCKILVVIVIAVACLFIGYFIGKSKNSKNGALLESLNKRVRKLSFIDLKLIQLATFCFALIIAKLAPLCIGGLRLRWLTLAMIICLIKPVYVIWGKKK